MQRTSRGLALAFAGTLAGSFALALALLSADALAAACLIATTTYCLAEFIERARHAPDAGL